MEKEILVFSDKHCTPCQKLKVILDKEKVQYTTIDVEEEPEKTVEWNISVLPTIILL